MYVLLRTTFVVFLVGLTLDFRAADTDSGISFFQYLPFAVTVLGGLGVIVTGLTLTGGRITLGSRTGSLIVWASVMFCAWSPIAVAVSSDTAHKDFISVILPYTLYTQAILVTLIGLQCGVSTKSVVRILIIVSAVSCAWRLVYAVTFADIELSEARWKILSPTLPLILGASAAALSTGRNRKLGTLGLLYFLSIVALSVTRGYLLSLGAVVAASVITAKWRGSELRTSRSATKKLLLIGAVGILLAGASLLVPDDVSSRWTDRLTGEKADGQEITLLVRLAEYKGMYDDLTQRRSTLLAGRGFGARYAYDDDLISVLEFIDPTEGLESTNGADSTWGYPIFAHGIIVGTALLVGLIAAVISSFKRCRWEMQPTREPFIACFVFYSLAAFMGVSLTANILNERLGGVVVGALVALAIRSVRASQSTRFATENRSLQSA